MAREKGLTTPEDSGALCADTGIGYKARPAYQLEKQVCADLQEKPPLAAEATHSNGEHFVTRKVRDKIDPVEYFHIIQDLEIRVDIEDGIEKFQRYGSCLDGREILIVDDRTHWTMMFSDEFEELANITR